MQLSTGLILRNKIFQLIQTRRGQMAPFFIV